jgi:hypothetical protein
MDPLTAAFAGKTHTREWSVVEAGGDLGSGGREKGPRPFDLGGERAESLGVHAHCKAHDETELGAQDGSDYAFLGVHRRQNRHGLAVAKPHPGCHQK